MRNPMPALIALPLLALPALAQPEAGRPRLLGREAWPQAAALPGTSDVQRVQAGALWMCGDSWVGRLDLATGRIVWSVRRPVRFNRLLVLPDARRVLASGYGGRAGSARLVCLELDTGALVWEHEGEALPAGTLHLSSSGELVLAAGDRAVAFELAGGKPRWDRRLPYHAWSWAAAGGGLWACGQEDREAQGRLDRLDAATGTARTEAALARPTHLAPIEAEVLVGQPRSLERRAAGVAEPRWTWTVRDGETLNRVESTPHGVLVSTSAPAGGRVALLDPASGRERWEAAPKSPRHPEARAAVCPAGVLVWVTTGDYAAETLLACHDPRDGRRLWAAEGPLSGLIETVAAAGERLLLRLAVLTPPPRPEIALVGRRETWRALSLATGRSLAPPGPYSDVSRPAAQLVDLAPHGLLLVWQVGRGHSAQLCRE